MKAGCRANARQPAFDIVLFRQIEVDQQWAVVRRDERVFELYDVKALRCHLVAVIKQRVVDGIGIVFLSRKDLEVKSLFLVVFGVCMRGVAVLLDRGNVVNVDHATLSESLEGRGRYFAVEVASRDYWAVVFLLYRVVDLKKLCGVLHSCGVGIGFPRKVGRADRKTLSGGNVLKHAPCNRLGFVARAVAVKVIALVNDAELVLVVEKRSVVDFVRVGGGGIDFNISACGKRFDYA